MDGHATNGTFVSVLLAVAPIQGCAEAILRITFCPAVWKHVLLPPCCESPDQNTVLRVTAGLMQGGLL